MRDGDREATYLARLDGEIVGTAYVRANGVGLSDHICNAGWMISPAHQGRGIGRPFADHVIEQARSFGYRAMQFNAVVATNTGAIALWDSLGFEIVGTVPEAFRHGTEGLTAVHVMYRRL
jgi:ribosomal protein S18 acetylase RimI-like enzyme